MKFIVLVSIIVVAFSHKYVNELFLTDAQLFAKATSACWQMQNFRRLFHMFLFKVCQSLIKR